MINDPFPLLLPIAITLAIGSLILNRHLANEYLSEDCYSLSLLEYLHFLRLLQTNFLSEAWEYSFLRTGPSRLRIPELHEVPKLSEREDEPNFNLLGDPL